MSVARFLELDIFLMRIREGKETIGLCIFVLLFAECMRRVSLQDDTSMLDEKNLATPDTYSTLSFQDMLNHTTYALLHCAAACGNLGFTENKCFRHKRPVCVVQVCASFEFHHFSSDKTQVFPNV